MHYIFNTVHIIFLNWNNLTIVLSLQSCPKGNYAIKLQYNPDITSFVYVRIIRVTSIEFQTII